jgi:hypothetical protein
VAALEGAKKMAQAEAEARRRLVLAPDCPQLHKIIARHLQQRNFAHAAGEHLARVLALEGDSPELALVVAANWHRQAKTEKNIAAAARALELAPDNVHAHVAYCYALHHAGATHSVAFGVAVMAALEKFGARAALARIRGLLFSEGKDFAAAVGVLKNSTAPIELLDRGRYKERLGDYGGAWADWMEAKRIQRESEGLIYQPDLFARQVAELMDSSRPPRVFALLDHQAPVLSPAPIFICGFPRSGTTMLEAALSAHPAIAAGDELAALPDLIRHIPALLSVPAPIQYPRALAALAWPENAGAAALLAQHYLQHALNRIGEAGKPFCYFTDKMPSNELHIPLLDCLFPASPIIHVRRHPLDILTSCMSQFLVHGGHNACALEWCAHHYALTDSLVDHYRKKCPPPNFREVRYEAFVKNVAGELAPLLPAGLALEPAQVEFHKSEWKSATLSYRQIKEPAHSNSVGRYKPFLEFFKPVLPLLAPTLDREGYSL